MAILHPSINNYLDQIIPQRDSVLMEMEAYAKEQGSAYWMAKGLCRPEPKITCTEGSQENADRGMGYFKRGGIADRVDYHVGDALEIIDQTTGSFDIILRTLMRMGIRRHFVKQFRAYIPDDCSSRKICCGWVELSRMMGTQRRSASNS